MQQVTEHVSKLRKWTTMLSADEQKRFEDLVRAGNPREIFVLLENWRKDGKIRDDAFDAALTDFYWSCC